MITTRAIKITAAVALIAVVGIATGAWYGRRDRVQDLVTAAEAVDAVIDQWYSVRAVIQADLPSAHYRTPEIEQDAAERLRRSTTATLRSLDDAIADVRGVPLAGRWSVDVDVARDSYIHHARRWTAYLREVAEDPVAALDEPPPPFTASRAASEEAFASALPPFAGDELRRRVAALLER
ncbi:MAG TPA: hypothetical protein VK923_10730 [Euzebyales bacterium]|nr:hypothetical protein [Euzebyales bacterium]